VVGALSMESSPTRIVLTGFGRFNGVADNPTSRMAPKLMELAAKLPGVEMVTCEVLEVSALECLRFFRRVKPDKEAIFVHLGVASSRTEICLEQCAYNNADFRCPDERGWNPIQLPIEGERTPVTLCRRSPLPLEAICANLKKRFEVIRVSDDPGRFLCNYCFYQSLLRGYRALFVHVPPFEAIPMERQLEILTALIEQLRDTK